MSELFIYKIRKVSGLTANEFIELRATLRSGDDDEFQCDKCLKRPMPEEQLERFRALKGCFGKRGAPFKLREIEFTSCPGNFVSFDALHLIQMHDYFEKGTLPFEGSLSEQPAKAIEAFGVIKSHKYERLKSEANKQKLMGNRGRGGQQSKRRS